MYKIYTDLYMYNCLRYDRTVYDILQQARMGNANSSAGSSRELPAEGIKDNSDTISDTADDAASCSVNSDEDDAASFSKSDENDVSSSVNSEIEEGSSFRAKLKLFDRVQVRDTDDEEWADGTVMLIDEYGEIRVLRDGFDEHYVWEQMRSLSTTSDPPPFPLLKRLKRSLEERPSTWATSEDYQSSDEFLRSVLDWTPPDFDFSEAAQLLEESPVALAANHFHSIFKQDNSDKSRAAMAALRTFAQDRDMGELIETLALIDDELQEQDDYESGRAKAGTCPQHHDSTSMPRLASPVFFHEAVEKLRRYLNLDPALTMDQVLETAPRLVGLGDAPLGGTHRAKLDACIAALRPAPPLLLHEVAAIVKRELNLKHGLSAALAAEAACLQLGLPVGDELSVRARLDACLREVLPAA